MEKKTKKTKSKKVYIPLILVIIFVVSVGGYYYWQYMKYETTDDAVVDCDNVALGPKMMGRIARLYAEEGDSVRAGQLLAELDSTDLKAQKIQSEANIVQLMSNVHQMESKLDADMDNNKIFEINADKAKIDFDRATRQKEADVITQEQYENIRKVYLAANAQLAAAQTQLKVTRAQIRSAQAAVENGRALSNVVATQIRNTRLYSPFDGIVAKRWLLPGDIAQAGQTVFSINHSSSLWVSVYIEETKLRNIYSGQNAYFTIDAYPRVTFSGKVFSIGNNTASKFSLIPPTNASGNFTKITQRVQLKVSIDSVSEGNLDQYPLLSGMSAVIKLEKQ
jgi:membrane fusion protein, multidrug efflux system